MANFRSDDDRGGSRGRDDRGGRGGFRGRSGGGRFGGGRPGGGGFRRDSGRFERKPLEMHDATCDKCGKECQVPFKPSGGKPVLCSDCFRKDEGAGRSFSGRGRDGSSGSLEQLKKIEAKLDKIIKALKIDSA
jgi:CxxC-x17-CxxC domain-containing protein